LELINSSDASLIICHISLKKQISKPKSVLIFIDRPRFYFIKCLQKFLQKENKMKGVDNNAIVKTRNVAKDVFVGPFTYIGKNVSIESGTIIHSNVVIYGNTEIGRNVIIDSSTVIGADGFGFERNDDGILEKFPHIGGIEIHDDVEIGANVCIDRGTLENTVIGKGSKIDNLVHVAHNVKIGKNCIIVAQSLVAGSCVMEDNSYIAMSATIREKVRIGENAFVGMGSVVTKDVKKNSTVVGVPAKIFKSKKK